MADREFVLPSQTSVVSEHDRERARVIRDGVVKTVENRCAYIEQNGVDPAFAYPAANWACEDGQVRIAKRYEEMCQLDPALLARLRVTAHDCVDRPRPFRPDEGGLEKIARLIGPRRTVVSDSRCRGVSPAHETRCGGSGKRRTSPISATNTAASVGPTPGMAWIAV